jgi:protein ImuB
VALDALADMASSFSPKVERGARAVYLEVGDLGRLFATEELLLSALRAAATEVQIATSIAICGNKGVSRVLAHALSLFSEPRTRREVVVPRGGEGAALHSLPLLALGPSPKLLEQLEAWGLRTIGELAALPRAAASTRLGAEGALLHGLSRGESSELLQPTPPPTEIREEQELLDSLDNLEPLLFVLRGLLDRVTTRLRARSQACGDLVLLLGFQPGGQESRRVAVAAPTQKTAPLLELLRVALTTRPPTGSIERLVLTTTPVHPRPLQLDLFAPPGPAPERLATTLARLEALCGSGRVGRPVMPDSHVPSAASLSEFAPKPASSGLGPAAQPETPSSPRLLSARVLRPPQAVKVARSGEALLKLQLEQPSASCQQTKSVRRTGGPYRLRDVRGIRDYYDVELNDGDLLRLFHDLTHDRWFLDAIYD